jgi:hypothetical protein
MSRNFTFGLLIAIAASLSACANNEKQTEGKASPAAATLSPMARAADPVYAYVDDIRSDLSDGKVQIINQVMRLTPEESKIFWPIYHDYEDESFTLGDQRVEMTKSFVTAQTSGVLDDARASKLADEWFNFETQRLELLKKYHKQVSEQLSPIRAAQFVQIENRVGNVVDLMIASELPLVRGPSAAAVKAKRQ